MEILEGTIYIFGGLMLLPFAFIWILADRFYNMIRKIKNNV